MYMRLGLLGAYVAWTFCVQSPGWCSAWIARRGESLAAAEVLLCFGASRSLRMPQVGVSLTSLFAAQQANGLAHWSGRF